MADWETELATRGYQVMPVTIAHFVGAASLPMHHRDPWDRLLVAQAIAGGLTVVSPDRCFPSYGVPTLW